MFGMITHHDAAYKPLADLTWHQNKTEYAMLHGYGMYAKTEDFYTANPKGPMNGFEKIYIAKEVLDEDPDTEWLWWTGTDSMITNFSTKIEHRINNDYHFIICIDNNGVNADSLLIRNTPEAKEFLGAILALQDKFKDFWDTEQRAIGYLLGFPGTGESTWPTGKDIIITNEWKNVVKLVPQRYMNSFNYKLYHYTDHRDKLLVNGMWSFGDWLIHWPGLKIEDRIKLYHLYKDQIVR